MSDREPKRVKKNICASLLAHVDAGKTTLSEAMLYLCGNIRKLGRVDKKDAFFDTDSRERERGITIFSKQAQIMFGDLELTVLDTPGHVDFSAEMERTLQILDYAILIISGSDGVQSHTHTLWKLLCRYEIPVFIFVNKMDQPGTDAGVIMKQLRRQLDDGCVDFSRQGSEEFFEEIAVCGEEFLETFLGNGQIAKEQIRNGIRERKIFPCFFGSALKLVGVETFLEGLSEYTVEKSYPGEFGARVFKITHDVQGNRLTHMKITGGVLKTREMIRGKKQYTGEGEEKDWQEKVNQIRIYSGEKFEITDAVHAGHICAVTGLTNTWSGEGLGVEEKVLYPVLEPVLGYRIILPEEVDAAVMLPKLRQLEEEDPQLHIVWNEINQDLTIQIMGQVQTEVLKNLIEERFGISVEFGEGNIIYKETIANVVEGVGHFEPLRHYAEVHLKMEPGEAGSGVAVDTKCSLDLLERNWQRLILTHLEEREHVGVLTGSFLTDVKITLTAGRAHLKHTEGGDFRQATYRAVRQGLMQAQNILLEPWYEFRLEIPVVAVGRAMADLEVKRADFALQDQGMENAVLTGMAPVSELQGYQKDVAAYTKGRGMLSCTVKGYFPCHNTLEVMERIGYDPLRDTDNPASSVFCAHGAGFVVEWDQVPEYMHLESTLPEPESEGTDEGAEGELQFRSGKSDALGIRPQTPGRNDSKEQPWIGTDEIDAILQRTACANQKKDGNGTRKGWKRTKRIAEGSLGEVETRNYKPLPPKEPYLLVDGYNVIFAWQELRELAQVNIDGARGKLLDILCNYQAIKRCSLIVVFDAYRLVGHPTEAFDYHNIHVVYTKEAETADHYVERFAHENSGKYDVTVATSDGLEQIIIRGEGCKLLSARDLEEEIKLAQQRLREDYLEGTQKKRAYLFDGVDREALEQIYQRSQKT